MTATESTERLASKLKIISNSFRRIADESTSELGITGMQAFLLEYLRRKSGSPPCQHDIEERFNIKHPTATGLMARLCEKGYVEFKPDMYDRRMKRIFITRSGMDAAERTRSRLEGMEERLTSGFSPEELSTLHALLDKLVENAKNDGRCRPKEGE